MDHDERILKMTKDFMERRRQGERLNLDSALAIMIELHKSAIELAQTCMETRNLSDYCKFGGWMDGIVTKWVASKDLFQDIMRSEIIDGTIKPDAEGIMGMFDDVIKRYQTKSKEEKQINKQ